MVQEYSMAFRRSVNYTGDGGYACNTCGFRTGKMTEIESHMSGKHGMTIRVPAGSESETYVPLKTVMHVDFDPDCRRCSAIASDMEDHYAGVHADHNPDGTARRLDDDG